MTPLSKLDINNLRAFVSNDPTSAATLKRVLEAFSVLMDGVQSHDIQYMTGCTPEQAQEAADVAAAVIASCYP